jgi:hypothetical protein
MCAGDFVEVYADQRGTLHCSFDLCLLRCMIHQHAISRFLFFFFFCFFFFFSYSWLVTSRCRRLGRSGHMFLPRHGAQRDRLY